MADCNWSRPDACNGIPVCSPLQRSSQLCCNGDVVAGGGVDSGGSDSLSGASVAGLEMVSVSFALPSKSSVLPGSSSVFPVTVSPLPLFLAKAAPTPAPTPITSKSMKATIKIFLGNVFFVDTLFPLPDPSSLSAEPNGSSGSKTPVGGGADPEGAIVTVDLGGGFREAGLRSLALGIDEDVKRMAPGIEPLLNEAPVAMVLPPSCEP